MTRMEVHRIVRRRPFQPFVVESVNGKRYRFKSPEEFILSHSAIITLDRNYDPVLLSLVRIASLKVEEPRSRIA